MMKTLHIQYLLAIFVLGAILIGPGRANARTNDVWSLLVSSSNISLAGLTGKEVCAAIEKVSKEVDPQHRGVRIVYTLGDDTDSWGGKVISFEFEQASLLDLLGAFDVIQLKYIVTDDVAIVGWKEYIRGSATLYGECVDVVTRRPITNFKVKGSSFLSEEPVLAVSSNGSYVCGVPYREKIGRNPEMIFLSYDAQNYEISVTAPGYKPREYTLEISHCGREVLQHLDLELQPLPKPDENKTRGPDSGQPPEQND